MIACWQTTGFVGGHCSNLLVLSYGNDDHGEVNRISRRSVLTLPLVLCRSGFGRAAARPNILFIMTDDHAAHALSCYGSRVNRTPNLDRIAREGIRFDRCFATNSICSPSRASILTGKYSHMNGVPVFNRFDGSQPTVQKMLQEAGYHTAVIGKWHLGSNPTGFDYWNVLPGQGRYIDPIFYDNEGSQVYPGYATDVVTDLTIETLKNRPKDRPFFVLCHHKAPHREWMPDEPHRRLFEAGEIREPPTLWDNYEGRTDALHEQQQSVAHDLTRRDLKLTAPSGLSGQALQQWLGVKPDEVEVEAGGVKEVLRGDNLTRWKYQRYMRDYLACVQSVDDNVGRLLGWLDSSGLARSTVVIYTSDQGFFLGDHGLFDKRFMYEQSIRMPFIVRWPEGIRAGRSTPAIAINCDFAPTFLELAGHPVPADMQGRSLVPLLKGRRPRDWRTAMYYRYYHDPGDHNTRAHYGIRTERHKLIYFWKKNQWECYDLVADPGEMHNIYSDPASQGVVAKLKQRLWKLKQELKDDDQYAEEQPRDSSYTPPPPPKKSKT